MDQLLANSWLPIAYSSDVEIQKPQVLDLLEPQMDFVLWRTMAGKVTVLRNRCTHRSSRFADKQGRLKTAFVGENIVCPYHGLQVSPEGCGMYFPAAPTYSASKFQIEKYPVEERNGLVWMCLANPNWDIPDFPEADDDSFRKIRCGPYYIRAAAPRFIENALDVAHFPFVHQGILGLPERAVIEPYEVTVTDREIIARDIKVYQLDPDGTGNEGEVYYTFRIKHPMHIYLQKTVGDQRFTIYTVVLPLSQTESMVFLTMAMNYGFDIPLEELIAFQDEITYQDVPVVENQRPQLLPRDLQAEVHMPFDLASIRYRQWINRLGLTFGTE